MNTISRTVARPNGSTREYVYQTLKEQIISWKLKPGNKISEKEIAEELQVSRTPVREAFLKLSQEELIHVYPQSGTVVAQIDLELVEEARFVREQIEKAVIREACEKFTEDQLFQMRKNLLMQELCLEEGTHEQLFELDFEFHKLIFEGCNKLRTWELSRQFNSHFDRLRMLRLVSNPNWNVIILQHKEMFELISKRDPDKAEEMMVKHLNLVILEKEEVKAQYPDYFK